jgi:hypothetical protein
MDLFLKKKKKIQKQWYLAGEHEVTEAAGVGDFGHYTPTWKRHDSCKPLVSRTSWRGKPVEKPAVACYAPHPPGE